jgi:hypothetical protein
MRKELGRAHVRDGVPVVEEKREGGMAVVRLPRVR